MINPIQPSVVSINPKAAFANPKPIAPFQGSQTDTLALRFGRNDSKSEAIKQFFDAISAHNIVAVQGFLEGPIARGDFKIDVKDSAVGWTALHRAANSLQPDILKMLLDAGANPNVKTEGAYTPLHYAVVGAVNGQRVPLVELLLQAKAKINAKTYRGETPLHHAARSGDSQVVQALLTAGADPMVKSKIGFTPFQDAVKDERYGNAKLILQHLGKFPEGLKIEDEKAYFKALATHVEPWYTRWLGAARDYLTSRS